MGCATHVKPAAFPVEKHILAKKRLCLRHARCHTMPCHDQSNCCRGKVLQRAEPCPSLILPSVLLRADELTGQNRLNIVEVHAFECRRLENRAPRLLSVSRCTRLEVDLCFRWAVKRGFTRGLARQPVCESGAVFKRCAPERKRVRKGELSGT